MEPTETSRVVTARRVILLITILLQQIMKQAQLKITVHIHHIKLQVKFPCSLTASLRIETEEVSYGQQIPLRLGQAMFDQSASQQLTVLYDPVRKAFEEKKIGLLLFLKSSSGRIPAGSISLSMNAIGKGISKEIIPVEKCPDKQAVACISVQVDVLNEFEWLQRSQVGMVRKQSPRESQTDKRITFGNGGSKGMKGSMMQRSAYKKKVHHQDSDGISPKTSKEIQDTGHQESKTQLMRSVSGRRQQSQVQSSRSPNHYTEYSSKSKQNHLERQLKNLQAKYQHQSLQLKNANAKKDILERSLKETEGQLRIAKEKYQDIKIEYDNLLKKNQYKDNTLKQQLKTISQKLAISESERQKMIFQKNDLVNEFEERQKNLRLGLKEKEKSINDEKIKLAKKLETLNNEYNQLKAQYSESDALQSEARKELTQERKRYEQLEYLKASLLQQVALLKNQLNQQKAQRKQLEEALGANVELQEQKKRFRKKIGELEQEITKNLKNIAVSEANAQKYQRRCQELEANLQQKVAISKNQQAQVDRLSREVQNLKNSVQELQKRLEQLSTGKQRQSQKQEGIIKQLNQTLRRQQEQIKGKISELKYKENVILGLKQQMENECQETEAISKKKSELEIQLLEERNNYSKLQYQYEQISSSKENLQNHKNELEVQLDSYIHELEELEKQRKSELAERQDQKRQLVTKIKSLQYSIEHSTEESSFQLKELQRKIQELTKECNSQRQEIDNLQGYISSLETDRSKAQHTNEELEYQLKLKANQTVFLNETLQKANQDITISIAQNKKLQIEIQSQRRRIDELSQEVQRLNEQLSNAASAGSNTKQQLNAYKAKNIEDLTIFFKGIQGGIISSAPLHQEDQIAILMHQAIDKNNEYVVENQAIYKQLQDQHAQLKKEYEVMREELQNIEEVEADTALKLQQTSDQLSQELKKNEKLQQTIRDLENNLTSQQESTFVQCSQLQNEIMSLKEAIKSLEGQNKQKSEKCQQLDRNLTVVSRQLKELEHRNQNENKASSGQIAQLQAEIEKKRGQIEAKAAAIDKYGDLVKQLRDSLAEANKQNQSLKQINQNIRKRNQQGSQREHQLEVELNTIVQKFRILTNKESDLHKKHQQITIELNSLKNIHSKLQTEEKKLKAELAAAQSTIKIKEDTLVKSNNQIKSLQAKQRALQNEIHENQVEIQRLAKQSQNIGGVKDELQQKVVELTKLLDKKEKIHNLESQYLKPIREHLAFLRGHMAEYSRVGDQFESNKNKLLKMASSKVQQYTERNVAEKLREVSLVFQRLKSFLLSGVGLTASQKESITEEVKKVQLALDRSLRGDK